MAFINSFRRFLHYPPNSLDYEQSQKLISLTFERYFQKVVSQENETILADLHLVSFIFS